MILRRNAIRPASGGIVLPSMLPLQIPKVRQPVDDRLKRLLALIPVEGQLVVPGPGAQIVAPVDRHGKGDVRFVLVRDAAAERGPVSRLRLIVLRARVGDDAGPGPGVGGFRFLLVFVLFHLRGQLLAAGLGGLGGRVSDEVLLVVERTEGDGRLAARSGFVIWE